MVLVVAAILVDDLECPTRALAARRTGPAALAGRWEFPGGKVEPGETPLAALRRELGEELGVTVTVGRELPGPSSGIWPISPDAGMRVWLARAADGHPTPTSDHDALCWLGPDELFAVDWLPADLDLVAELADRMRGVTPARRAGSDRSGRPGSAPRRRS